jgi:hypothetical protein
VALSGAEGAAGRDPNEERGGVGTGDPGLKVVTSQSPPEPQPRQTAWWQSS